MFHTGNVGYAPTTIAIGATSPVPPEGIGATCWSTTAGLLTWDGTYWGPQGANGTTIVTFGSTPSQDASVFIADTNILTSSVVEAWIVATATSDHTVDEHRIEALVVMAGNIVAGSGFTIYVEATNGPVYGAWSVAWSRGS